MCFAGIHARTQADHAEQFKKWLHSQYWPWAANNTVRRPATSSVTR